MTPEEAGLPLFTDPCPGGKIKVTFGIWWFSEHYAYLTGYVECCKPFSIWDVDLEIKSVVSWELAGIIALCQRIVKRHTNKVVLNQQSDVFKLDLPLLEGLIFILVYSSWVSEFTTNLYHGDLIKLLNYNYRIGVVLQHPSKHLHAGAPETILEGMRKFWRPLCHFFQ